MKYQSVRFYCILVHIFKVLLAEENATSLARISASTPSNILAIEEISISNLAIGSTSVSFMILMFYYLKKQKHENYNITKFAKLYEIIQKSNSDTDFSTSV
ncbi:unnamed protein product [Owenia fusiformis]|uniref:Uncharacterized protein n=1 Tax=Owenia fusiformis TaxID=6347 RepID=A0A8S4N025_OWEFU|nr:unnamed protein product [Owenia fusiformis]